MTFAHDVARRLVLVGQLSHDEMSSARGGYSIASISGSKSSFQYNYSNFKNAKTNEVANKLIY